MNENESSPLTDAWWQEYRERLFREDQVRKMQWEAQKAQRLAQAYGAGQAKQAKAADGETLDPWGHGHPWSKVSLECDLCILDDIIGDKKETATEASLRDVVSAILSDQIARGIFPYLDKELDDEATE